MAELTAKQRRFCEEYLIDLNATKAAERAGYSKETAYSIGHELLKKPEIIAEITRLQAERSKRTGINADWLLARLADEAMADVADLYTDGGELRPVSEWPMIWRQGLVQGIDVEELFDGRGKDREQIGVVRKIKLSDRVRRLELIGRHIGVKAFEDTVNVKGLEGLGDRLSRALKRVDEEEGGE
ncbi:terminase small subunit [Pleomorphomonas oryzae]|uniref:terminase small subunit n=1 Tax=Pleomorphomonas oryzae TaxID=261934 RepID=UPI0004046A2E|nr:terminase small subunit [Pleomorphomonas oryzae]